MRLLSRLLPVFLLTLSGVFAQSTSLRGPYGFLLNVSYDDPSNQNGMAILGVINFDGAGNLTGSDIVRFGAGGTDVARTVPGTLTGTYSTNSDGTGVVILNAAGNTITTMMVITDGGQGLQLVTTDCTCDLSGGVLSGVARAAYSGPLKGSYGFQIANSPKPAVTTIGVANFDGAGNIAVSLTIVASGGSGKRPTVQTTPLTGTYSLNPDGSGVLNFPMSGGSTSSTAIVVVDGGSGILTLGTAGNDVVQLGTARLQ